MSSHQKLSICPNCSYHFQEKENFCPQCGQENHSLNIPIGHLIYEGIEGVFHFDTKFFRTAKLLLLRPGLLSKEFNEGKRARFVPPFRLYIFISFVFFFVLAIYTHPEEGLLIQGKVPETKLKLSDENDIFNFSVAELKTYRRMSDAQLDSILKAKNIAPSTTKKYLIRQIGKIAGMSKSEFVHKMIKNTSIAMFLLMPFFALLLMLFYFKRKMYYFQLLIFSIHLHSFIFLFLTVILLLGYFFNIEPVDISLLILFIYLVISLKNFFNQSIAKTILKSFLLSFTYSISLIIFFIGVLLMSLLF